LSFILSTHLTFTLFPYTTLFRSYLIFKEFLQVLHSLVQIAVLRYLAAGVEHHIIRVQMDARADALLLPIPISRLLPLRLLLNLRSEEHTSELQSRFDLVCRLLLE